MSFHYNNQTKTKAVDISRVPYRNEVPDVEEVVFCGVVKRLEVKQ